jgi:hypothetical protein
VTAARTPRLLAIVAAAALFTISACTSNSTPSDRVSSSTTSSTRDIPLQTKRQADVVAVLKTYGDTIAATVGAPLENWDTVAAPCGNADGSTATDGRFDMTGNANISVPAAQHITQLTKLRDQWKQQGYELTEFRTFPPENQQGRSSARNPTDGVTISVQSTQPATAFAVLIATPCYIPAPGEHPGS